MDDQDGGSGLVVRVDHDGATSTIALRGEVDIAGVDTLAAALDEVRARGRRAVVVDLAGVRFADVAGLGPLAAAGSDGLHVRLRNVPPLTTTILRVTGWDAVLAIEP